MVTGGHASHTPPAQLSFREGWASAPGIQPQPFGLKNLVTGPAAGNNYNRTRHCSVTAQPFVPQPPAAPHSPVATSLQPPRWGNPPKLQAVGLALVALWVGACCSTPGDRQRGQGRDKGLKMHPGGWVTAEISEGKGKASRATWEHDAPHGCSGSLFSLALGEQVADFRPSPRAPGSTCCARRDSPRLSPV